MLAVCWRSTRVSHSSLRTPPLIPFLDRPPPSATDARDFTVVVSPILASVSRVWLSLWSSGNRIKLSSWLWGSQPHIWCSTMTRHRVASLAHWGPFHAACDSVHSYPYCSKEECRTEMGAAAYPTTEALRVYRITVSETPQSKKQCPSPTQSSPDPRSPSGPHQQTLPFPIPVSEHPSSSLIIPSLHSKNDIDMHSYLCIWR